MDDFPTKRPPRRRWRRWFAFWLALLIACCVWMLSGESEISRRSKGLQVGMTATEVDAMIGEPEVVHPSPPQRRMFSTYASPLDLHIMRLKRILAAGAVRIGVSSKPQYVHWPVEVIFDEHERVAWFIRGGEVVGQPGQIRIESNHSRPEEQ